VLPGWRVTRLLVVRAMTERPAYAADALGIGIATGVYGISFGVLAGLRRRA